MIKTINEVRYKTKHPETHIKEFMQDLEEHGCFVVDDWLVDPYTISALNQEAESALKILGKPTAFGSAVRFQDGDSGWKPFKETYNLFNAPWMQTITRRYLGENANRNAELFYSHEFKQGDLRSGDLHFDRLNALKFFVYLTDVDVHNGPLKLVPDAHRAMRKRRIDEWSRFKDYNKIRNRVEIDWPALGYREDLAFPVYGAAGTVVVFDTDVLHCGGKVDKGYERMVVRAHNRKPNE